MVKGGICEMTLGVICNRCGEKRAIEDEESVAFYKAWASRENKDDRMFVAILNSPDGTTVDVDYEYVCPKCIRVIYNNLAKINTDLVPPKDEGKEPPPEDPPKPKDPPPSKNEKPEDPPPPPPEDPPADSAPPEDPLVEEPGGEPGTDYSDNDLFDD